MASISPVTRRPLWSLGATLALAVSTTLALANPLQFVTVKRVIDGDTTMLESGERVRLIGVDTPESVDPRRPVERFGKEASAFTRRTAQGKRVRLEYDPANAVRGHKDNTQQKRTLAYVFLEDGTLLNGAFFRVLKRQRPAIRQAWLRYWMFSDDGATLVPKPRDGTAEPLSLEEKRKIASLFAATLGKRSKTLH